MHKQLCSRHELDAVFYLQDYDKSKIQQIGTRYEQKQSTYNPISVDSPSEIKNEKGN